MKFSVLASVFLFSTVAFANWSDFIVRTDVQVTPFSPLPKKGLRIFWWNIGCSLDHHFPEQQFENLERLIASKDYAPDVLALGEYCPDHFKQSTYNKIIRKYPHVFRIKKSNEGFNIQNGMRVFSRYKLKTKNLFTLPAGDFLESPIVKNCDPDYKKRNPKFMSTSYWTRPAPDLELKHKGKTYRLAPVHLANPWKSIFYRCSKLQTPEEIINGTQNQNYAQALALTEHFYETPNLILFGDFNASKAFLFFGASQSYQELSDVFGESLVSSTQATYIDSTTELYNSSVDHAFASENLKSSYAEVWPLSGSDHLPLYLVVD